MGRVLAKTRFNGSAGPTIGVEAELFLVDLVPTARSLGCVAELEQLARAAEGSEPGSVQPRRFAQTGDLKAVVRGAMEDLAAGL